MQFMQKNQADRLLIATITVIGIAVAALLYISAPPGSTVQIQSGGRFLGQYTLSVNRTFTIQTPEGETNTIVIENGSAYVSEASCKDGLCVQMGKIHLVNQSIICLPNKVVISISGPAGDENSNVVDAVAQ